MDDELHAAGFVKEPLEHNFLLRRQAAESSIGRLQIFQELFGRGRYDAKLIS